MPRFKPVDYSPRLLAVDLTRQVIAGTFEYALHHLLDHEIDLSAIEARYDNDEVGASAYDPRVLLKIVLLAYSRGIVSSRGMEAACRDNVLFMAISGDSASHYSTLASFVSSLGQALSKVFAQVLTICDRRGLIGREMFAIDGVKLPSNASKAKSGKRKDFLLQVAKMEKAVEQILAKHRDNDAAATDRALQPREQRHIERLQAEAQKMRDWLKQHPQERKSAKGKERLSNRTDNESAKMPTDKGVVQGYTGVAAVDEKHQIILEAQAHGSGSQQELLMPVTAAIAPMAGEHTVVCTDSGYHSQANLEQLEAQGIEAFIPDHNYRSRDPRYEGQEKHTTKPEALWDKSEKPARKPQLFQPCDFKVAADYSHCICPAGKRLGGTIRKCVNEEGGVTFRLEYDFNQRPVAAGMKGDATHEREDHTERVRVKGLLRDDGSTRTKLHSALDAGSAGSGGHRISGPRQVAAPCRSRGAGLGLPQRLRQAAQGGTDRGHDHAAPSQGQESGAALRE